MFIKESKNNEKLDSNITFGKEKEKRIYCLNKITLIFKDKHVFKKNKQTPASKYKKGNFICNKK